MRTNKAIITSALVVPLLAASGGIAYASTTPGGPAPRPGLPSPPRSRPASQQSARCTATTTATGRTSGATSPATTTSSQPPSSRPPGSRQPGTAVTATMTATRAATRRATRATGSTATAPSRAATADTAATGTSMPAFTKSSHPTRMTAPRDAVDLEHPEFGGDSILPRCSCLGGLLSSTVPPPGGTTV
jgi:hypothetical protein